MRRIASVLTIAVVMAAMTALAGPALAVTVHQHTINTPGTDAEISQGFCNGNAADDPAFENLHSEVHKGKPGTLAFEQPNNPVSISASGC